MFVAIESVLEAVTVGDNAEEKQEWEKLTKLLFEARVTSSNADGRHSKAPGI